MQSGALILAATPIGSSTDASQTLRDTLVEADVIAAEDTRRFLTLTKRLGIEPTGRVVSYFEGNEASRTAELAEAVADGQRVVLVTDAGMPSVSDPGYRLVVACVDAGLKVTAVPGPSAVLTALAVSGLPVDRFCFEGFLPRKAGERGRRLAGLAGEQRTMVFFEAPHRLADFLTDAARELGAERRGAICRELTKPYEEIIRGPLSELVDWAKEGVRGEVTVVIAGATPSTTTTEDALGLVREAMAGGVKLSAAVAEVAALTGTNKKALYSAALAEKEKK